MSHRLISRTLSFVIATVLTFGMLGGIDRLSAADTGGAVSASQWACRNVAPRA